MSDAIKRYVPFISQGWAGMRLNDDGDYALYSDVKDLILSLDGEIVMLKEENSRYRNAEKLLLENFKRVNAELSLLQADAERYQQWISEEGERTDMCTKNILGKVCSNCRCGIDIAISQQQGEKE